MIFVNRFDVKMDEDVDFGVRNRDDEMILEREEDPVYRKRKEKMNRL